MEGVIIDNGSIQKESTGSPSDVQCQEEVEKAKRRRRRHSFRSSNGSESPVPFESESLAPGAYHERGYFAESDSDLIEDGNSTSTPAQDRTGSGGSQLPTETSLNSLVPVNSTPDSSDMIAVIQAHVVVEQSVEDHLASEMEALQAEIRGQIEEVNRTLGAITTAEVIVPDDHYTTGDIPPDNNNRGYHPTTKKEMVDDGGKPFLGLATCCTKRHLWVTLLLLLLTGAIVGIVIGTGKDDPLPKLTPTLFCQMGPDLEGERFTDVFGFSVAISSNGTRVAIGAPFSSNSNEMDGKVSILDWSGSQWDRAGSDLTGGSFIDQFGWSVALSSDGSRVAIGSVSSESVDAGYARIFDWSGSQWVQAGSDLLGELIGDRFGFDVALSDDGNRIAIGAPEMNETNDDAGYARIFEWSDSQWVQLGSDLDGEANGDAFGWSIALSSDGNRVAIGAPNNDGSGYNPVKSIGHVRIFDWTGNQWVQAGSDLEGEGVDNGFGWSVALSADGNRVAIGALGNGGNGEMAGQVRIFDWSESQWVQAGTDLDGEAGDAFGCSVALSSDGNRVAIGACQKYGTQTEAGHVGIFDWSGSKWEQVGFNLTGRGSEDFFGQSVALSSDGSHVAIGAGPMLCDGTCDSPGYARIYQTENSSCTDTH